MLLCGYNIEMGNTLVSTMAGYLVTSREDAGYPLYACHVRNQGNIHPEY